MCLAAVRASATFAGVAQQRWRTLAAARCMERAAQRDREGQRQRRCENEAAARHRGPDRPVGCVSAAYLEGRLSYSTSGGERCFAPLVDCERYRSQSYKFSDCEWSC